MILILIAQGKFEEKSHRFEKEGTVGRETPKLRRAAALQKTM